MHLLVFDAFARTINNLPAEDILKALDLESFILKSYSENHRLYLPAEAYSIFCFGQFVRAAKCDEPMPNCKPLPPNHLKFYKQTVVRLIQANELPPSTLDQFDSAFPASGQQ